MEALQPEVWGSQTAVMVGFFEASKEETGLSFRGSVEGESTRPLRAREVSGNAWDRPAWAGGQGLRRGLRVSLPQGGPGEGVSRRSSCSR